MEFSLDNPPKIGAKTKIATGIAIALVVVVLLLEMTLLRGQQIANMTVGLGANESGTIVVHDVGEKHLVEVRATRRRGGKTEGRRIKIRLEDPNGEVVYEGGDWSNKKERYFTFTPATLGSYGIFVEPEVLAGSSTGYARVRVFVGDKRFLTRFFAATPF